MAMIRRDTVLKAPPDAVWQALQRPATLLAVSAPLLRLRAIDPPSFPEVWSPGETLVAMHLFGIIPMGRQVISVSFEDQDGARRILRDNGHGGLARRWDHRIIITPAPGGGTAYADEVAIEAGALTPFVALFARIFYAHRQRRWHKLIASGALPGGHENGPA